ncbi:unnamed protein product [Protopolystoma xenopodis]|uniref:Uncharacterized protein n=1 Tax=Protopolystoma xenopodis TaxID=117903 RepID=A0A3S5A6G1_9PLAT|nr:unnamed protein product [Protopolystoma xenopodis]
MILPIKFQEGKGEWGHDCVDGRTSQLQITDQATSISFSHVSPCRITSDVGFTPVSEAELPEAPAAAETSERQLVTLVLYNGAVFSSVESVVNAIQALFLTQWEAMVLSADRKSCLDHQQPQSSQQLALEPNGAFIDSPRMSVSEQTAVCSASGGDTDPVPITGFDFTSPSTLSSEPLSDYLIAAVRPSKTLSDLSINAAVADTFITACSESEAEHKPHNQLSNFVIGPDKPVFRPVCNDPKVRHNFSPLSL